MIGRCAMPREIDIIVEAGLRGSQSHAGEHKGEQREHRRRRKTRYSMPSASSSEETTLASIFHSLESTPDENGQLPRSTYPTSTFLARPAGNIKDDAIRTSGFFQTKS